MNQKLAKGAAAVGAVGVLVFGAAAIGGANSNSTSGATQRNGFGPGGGAPPGAPGGARPGLGTPVSDDVATKVARAATAKYPGRIERVDQTPDGAYVAHVITSSGEVHVLVSKDFQVIGKADFGDWGRFRPPGTQSGKPPAAPSGSGPSDDSNIQLREPLSA